MSMGILKGISFDEYLLQSTGKNIDLRPAGEIIDDVEEVRRLLEG